MQSKFPSCPFIPWLRIYLVLKSCQNAVDCRGDIIVGSSGGNSLLPHALGVSDDLVRSTLDNAAGFGELSADAHEEDVDVAGCLAAFVDAPGSC